MSEARKIYRGHRNFLTLRLTDQEDSGSPITGVTEATASIRRLTGDIILELEATLVEDSDTEGDYQVSFDVPNTTPLIGNDMFVILRLEGQTSSGLPWTFEDHTEVVRASTKDLG